MIDRMPLWAFMTVDIYDDWLYDDMTPDDDDDLLSSFFFDDDDDDESETEDNYDDDPSWFSNMIY